MALGYKPPRLPTGLPRPAAPKFQKPPAPLKLPKGWMVPSTYNALASAAKAKPAGSAAAPGGGPAASPAASVPQLAPLPPDASYEAQIAGLTKTRDDTLAQLKGTRTRALADYGYNATYDQGGNVAGLQFDPNNAFSRAAVARTRYQQSKTGTQNSMASRGQLYAGALDQAQGINDVNFQRTDDSLQKQLQAALAGILGQESTARTAYETGAGQAYGDRVTRAGDNPLYTPSSGAQAAAAPAAPTGNTFKPGTPEWAKYAQQHGESWKQVNGKWYRRNAKGGWTPSG